MNFWGYKRPDGKVGIRNHVLIFLIFQSAFLAFAGGVRLFACHLFFLLLDHFLDHITADRSVLS